MVWSCMVNAWLSTSTRARRRIRNGYNWETNIANGFPGLRRYEFVRFGMVITVTLAASVCTRSTVAMTAKNVAEEVSREAGRLRNQPVRPPPIEVDASLAMDDVPEDDKSLRWYSITIGAPGANMPAMWFDIVSTWMMDTSAGTCDTGLCAFRIRTTLTYCAASAQLSRALAWSRSDTTRKALLVRATAAARPVVAADPARAAPATDTVRVRMMPKRNPT